MKKIWIIWRVVGVCVCLFLFISSVKGIRTAGPEGHKTQAEEEQSWNNLEHAAPLLAEEYGRAIKKQQEVKAAYSFHNLRAISVTILMAILLISLLWQLVGVPIGTWLKSKISISLRAS